MQPADHRLRRERKTPRPVLLRPAGFGSAPSQFSAHRTGTGAAEALVRARPIADQSWWQRKSDFLERINVRIPHAATNHAELRKYPAGSDLQSLCLATD